ncbi:MAG: hypothetical protein NC132_02120, partial [Corallococcus sp.]|nr:hypothetical protein [Corallococcus sp.]MCM1359295.1 hypothetical protein [Corallococcus sp.]MCM1394894.1 hypothetical protein [Corallococcus sp.]
GYKALKPDPVTPDSKLGRSVGIIPGIAIFLYAVILFAVFMCSYSWSNPVLLVSEVICFAYVLYFLIRSGVYYAEVAVNGRKRLSPWEAVLGALALLPCLYFGYMAYELANDSNYASAVVFSLVIFALGVAVALLSLTCAIFHGIFRKQCKAAGIDAQPYADNVSTLTDGAVEMLGKPDKTTSQADKSEDDNGDDGDKE